MRYIEFGSQRVPASVIVLGLMRVKDKSPTHVARLIETALDEGINMLDTAPVYAPSETLLGDVFACTPGLRDKVLVQTKVGITSNPATGRSYYDFSKKHILESVDASLAALNTDHIDSLLLHRPDVLMEPDEIAEAFSLLRRSGKVLDFGVSNLNPAMIALLTESDTITLAANQVQMSIAHAPAIDAAVNVNRDDRAAIMREGGVLEYCRRASMTIQAWSPLQYGHMEGSFVGSDKYPKLNEELSRLAETYNVAPAAIALAWVLRYPANMQTVIGTTRPQRIRDAAAASEVSLTRPEWYDLYRAAGNDLP